MVRSLRSRKPALKYSTEEYIVEANSKKPRAKISDVVGKRREAENRSEETGAIEKECVEGSKGNIDSGRRLVKAILAPVLRDRTNLPGEPFKVDLLMKQGTTRGPTKKSTKPTSSNPRKVENPRITSLAMRMKNASKKVVSSIEESEENAADTWDNEAPRVDTEPKNPPVEAVSKKSAKTTERTSESSSSEKNHLESEEKESSLERPRKTSRKLEVDKEPLPHEIEKTSADDASAKKFKSARKSVKPTNRNIDKVEEEVSSDSNTETSKSVEPAIATRTSATTRNLAKRATSRKTLQSKKSEETVDSVKKSSLRSSRANDDDGTEKKVRSNPVARKKFFKSKVTGEIVSGIPLAEKTVVVAAKQKKVVARRGLRVSTSFRLRQTSLAESFAKQASRKVLRPRKRSKNYCEESTLLEKAGVPSNQVDEDAGEKKKSGPVYKSLDKQDKPVNDKNKIYEFQFDSEDSDEKVAKLAKRRRKKTVKKTVRTTTKARGAGSGLKKMTSSKPAVKKISEDKRTEKIDVVEQVSTEPSKPIVETETNVPPSQAPMEIDEAATSVDNPEVSSCSSNDQKPKGPGSQASVPRIVERVELRENERMKLTTTPVLVKSITDGENRAKNVPRSSNRFRTMLSHALINKSISPITRAIESFDPGSPWRPPTFKDQQFSRVRNLVQSTPRVIDLPGILKSDKIRAPPRNPPENSGRFSNDSAKRVPEICQSPSKAVGMAKSPRKFGTEISNVGNAALTSVARITDVNKENSREGRMMTENFRSSGIGSRVSGISIDVGQASDRHEGPTMFSGIDDLVGEKENCLPARPNKSPRKTLNESPLKKATVDSPTKSLEKSPRRPLEPRAGPSKSRNSDFVNDSRILRQSNLDNFLNIDEKPQSTRIKTIHGIFDDAHSTPISGKPIKKITNKNPNVDNAFGFDDFDDSDIDVSPIKGTIPNCRALDPNAENKCPNLRGKADAAPARLSINDIKKHLLPVRKETKISEKPIIEKMREEEKESRDKKEGEKKVGRNKKTVDPISFTDTFDLLAEKGGSNDSDVKEVSLFADTEPARFKQAPRYSYKRKRVVGFALSDDEGETASSASPEHREVKKRKISKVDREREKQLENWAENINRTFEEIDHFDLVVE